MVPQMSEAQALYLKVSGCCLAVPFRLELADSYYPGVESCDCFLGFAPDQLSGPVGTLLPQFLSFPIWSMYWSTNNSTAATPLRK